MGGLRFQSIRFSFLFFLLISSPLSIGRVNVNARFAFGFVFISVFFLAPNENNSNNKNDTKRGRRAQLRPPLSLSLSLARFPNDWNLCSVHQLETRIDRYISDEKEKEPRPIPRRCRLTNAYEILEKKRKKESRQFINWNGDDRPQLRRHHGPMRGEERAFNGPIRVSGSLSLSLSLSLSAAAQRREAAIIIDERGATFSLSAGLIESKNAHTKKKTKTKTKILFETKKKRILKSG